MSPNLNNLSRGHGRLLSGDHVAGDGNGDQHKRDDAGPDHVAAPFGELFTSSGIVNLFRGFLMK
jgi:hypothetical protein